MRYAKHNSRYRRKRYHSRPSYCVLGLGVLVAASLSACRADGEHGLAVNKQPYRVEDENGPPLINGGLQASPIRFEARLWGQWNAFIESVRGIRPGTTVVFALPSQSKLSGPHPSNVVSIPTSVQLRWYSEELDIRPRPWRVDETVTQLAPRVGMGQELVYRADSVLTTRQTVEPLALSVSLTDIVPKLLQSGLLSDRADVGTLLRVLRSQASLINKDDARRLRAEIEALGLTTRQSVLELLARLDPDSLRTRVNARALSKLRQPMPLREERRCLRISPGSQQATVNARITPLPFALCLEKAASVAQATPNYRVTFPLKCMNTGRQSLAQVLVVDVLPANTRLRAGQVRAPGGRHLQGTIEGAPYVAWVWTSRSGAQPGRVLSAYYQVEVVRAAAPIAVASAPRHSPGSTSPATVDATRPTDDVSWEASLGPTPGRHSEALRVLVDVSLQSQPIGTTIQALLEPQGIPCRFEPPALSRKHITACLRSLPIGSVLRFLIAGTGAKAQWDGEVLVITPS